ncbi:MAG: 3-oxoacyl-ACP reductase FabG [Pseudomonadota bacterium]|nr:3-oxoacyl-ACP reductase FabG [Pseudomonadota bacterium]
MHITLDGKIALVTGGSSGIGKGIALALAASGAQVAIMYSTHRESADASAKEIIDAGGKAIAVGCSISDPASVQAMFDTVEKELGPVDILVNSAGIDGKQAPSWEIDPADWRQVIDVNLIGAFLCARLALKGMVARRSGVVLNISSVHETIAWSGYSAYTASKAGVAMMTKTMAQEAAPFGVRVLALAPGAIKTDINRAVWDDPTQLKDLLTKIPLGRMGQVQDIADMAVVLVSDVGGYVTGTTVFVDGGMTDYPEFAHGG